MLTNVIDPFHHSDVSQCSGIGRDQGEQNTCTTYSNSLKCYMYLAVLERLTQHDSMHAL